MSTVELNKDNFHQTIENSPIVLIDFWAGWCGPCKSFAPVYESASEQHADILFGKIDTEIEQEIAAGFQIRSIPTLMAFKEQIVVFSQPGALPASALEKIIDGVRKLDMGQVRADIEEQKTPQAENT